jgi:hypothetical protein
MARAEDEGRFDRREDEDKDEVEAHLRAAMNEEPKAEDEGSDDVEAHIRPT